MRTRLLDEPSEAKGMTMTRFPPRIDLPAAELLRGGVALAALLLFLPGPAPAAEFTRDHRAQANVAGADRFADAFVLATYERTLHLLDEQTRQQAAGIVQRDYDRMRRQ